MNFAKCYVFKIGKGPTLYSEMDKNEYIEFSTALSTIEMAELEMYYAVLFRTGFHILSSISPNELQKIKGQILYCRIQFCIMGELFSDLESFPRKELCEII